MKTIFIAFAIEDERMRDFLKGQSLLTNSPFEYVDMSVKQAYDTDWKNKVRTRIRRSDYNRKNEMLPSCTNEMLFRKNEMLPSSTAHINK